MIDYYEDDELIIDNDPPWNDLVADPLMEIKENLRYKYEQGYDYYEGSAEDW